MILNPFTLRDVRRIKPFVSILRVVSDEFVLDPYVFGALGLRETGMTFGRGYSPKGSIVGWGDNHNGYGPFQIDKRYHSAFINSSSAVFLPAQARYAAGLLASNRRRVHKHFPLLSDLLAVRAYLAAYNASFHSVKMALTDGKDPDSVTTGKDYSIWILRKSMQLRRAAPNLFSVTEV